MDFKKENNQYYAEYIESKVVSLINHEDHFDTPECLQSYTFSAEEIKEMDEDAIKIANYIDASSAQWIGRHCSTESGDIIADGNRHIELKYVSSGTGTYLNASLSYFSDKLGFTPFTAYTHKTICPILEQEFGSKVYSNLSPVSQTESHYIRQHQKELYDKVKQADIIMRKQYVKDLFDYLTLNPDKLIMFINDVITKNVNSHKSTPSELIIFNHKTKSIICYSKESIESKKANKQIKRTELGLVFDNFRVAIGWQNGNGLNNPTFRVFLD